MRRGLNSGVRFLHLGFPIPLWVHSWIVCRAVFMWVWVCIFFLVEGLRVSEGSGSRILETPGLANKRRRDQKILDWSFTFWLFFYAKVSWILKLIDWEVSGKDMFSDKPFWLSLCDLALKHQGPLDGKLWCDYLVALKHHCWMLIISCRSLRIISVPLQESCKLMTMLMLASA